MTNEPFFPFTIYGSEDMHGVWEFRKTFQANRPEEITVVEGKGTKWEYTRTEKCSYYSFNVIVHSKTEVEFVCFDMLDNFYGGIGKESHRFRATCEEDLTSEFITRRLLHRAELRRICELEEQEALICAGYAEEERKVLGL